MASSPARQRLAAAERQTVAKGAGGKLGARHLVANVGHQARTVLTVAFQFFRREKAAEGKRRIEGGAAVALAEDEAVPLRPARFFWSDAQDIGVEHRQQIGHGKRSADVRAVGARHHSHCCLANSGRKQPGGVTHSCARSRRVGSSAAFPFLHAGGVSRISLMHLQT